MSAVEATDTRRQELASFVRSRRERLRPEQVGLPRSRRRRTPGLRREEVAQLAGVGVTWYTWLEQGRDINPSPQVLEAIARTLRFDAHERNHLFTLAGAPVAAPVDECSALFPTARAILDSLEPNSAVLMNARWDILAYNRSYASFFPDLDDVASEDRNCIWLAFTDPEWRQVIVDWEEVAARMVGEYRAAMAEHLDDPSWQALLERLLDASPDFAARWDRHEVRRTESSRKRVRHPELGVLMLDYTNLWLDPSLGARVVAFTPADEPTAARLRELQARL
ncbi:MAG TPA: helix-turn-helix transcriptional regulator [Gaiellaceae bacterium]|jgi:transcriptional regulator with XRE-family HTH domain|nr:helix-turn-helix transcriptional regulator [Gaiellaceae bacterium]